jgi:hypothetical protein
MVIFKTIKLLFILFMMSTLLFACKAKELNVDLRLDDAIDALDGSDIMVEFEAEFAGFGDLDDEKRTQVEALENILTKYMEVEDFELETKDNGFTITIEGQIPLTNNINNDSPYFLLISHSKTLEGYKELRFMTGDDFGSLKGEMQSINFMLAPDEYHPVKFKIKGSGKQILAPAVEVDGKSYLLLNTQLDGKLKLLFKGGVFEKTGAGFFFR